MLVPGRLDSQFELGANHVGLKRRVRFTIQLFVCLYLYADAVPKNRNVFAEKQNPLKDKQSRRYQTAAKKLRMETM